MRFVNFLLAVCSAATLSAAVDVPNGNFASGLDSWVRQPANSAAEVTVVPGGGNALVLTAAAANTGLTSRPIALTPEEAQGCFELTFDLAAEPVKDGIFGVSAYVLDARGKRLTQLGLLNLNNRTPLAWKTYKVRFGTGKTLLPAGAAALQLRFSFWDAKGKPVGKVSIAKVALKAMPAPKPGIDAAWPRSISAQLGDFGIRLESRSFWTLYRIDYRGVQLGVDHYGSHYGHVFNFKGVGFIGSGHVENENEQLLEITLELDGRKLDAPPAKLEGRELVLTRRSRVRTLEVASVLKIGNGRIDEAVTVTALEPTALHYAYLCMYPWLTSFSDYKVLDAGSTIAGSFSDSKKFMIDAPVNKVELYNRTLKKGIVTEVVEADNAAPRAERYWDVPGRYRKHYGMVARNRTLRPGEKIRYRTVTTAFDRDSK